jgi:antigen flippase
VVKSSYNQILKASTLLGGAQGLIYVASLIRGKAIALLLGTSGIGALSLYQTVIQSFQTVSNLGIPTSGVREISDSSAHVSPEVLNTKLVAVRRLSFLTGILGFTLMACLSYPLSHILGKNDTIVDDIVIMGVGVFFLCLAGGESAILQGLRKLKELAVSQVLSFLCSLPLLIGACIAFGLEGMATGLTATCASSWVITRRFTQGIGSNSSVTWHEVFNAAGPVFRLGSAVMSNAIAASVVALATKAIVTRESGLEANGILQASVTLAGMFVTFLFSAMGTDFLPRLSSAKTDLTQVNRLVNEQLEVAVALSAPGVLLTLAFYQWLIPLFFSHEFTAAGQLLPWFIVGNLLQMVSWPLGSIQIIHALPRTYALTQLLFHATHISLLILLYPFLHIEAVAASFFLSHALYFIGISFYARHQTGFRFTSQSLLQIMVSFGSLFIAILSGLYLTENIRTVITTLLGLLIALISAYRLWMVTRATKF